MSLEKKILDLLQENRVLTEDQMNSPTAVSRGNAAIDLGAPVVSPTQTSGPDFTKGVPTQTPYPTSKPTSPDIIGKDADAGKGRVGYSGIGDHEGQIGGGEWIVKEEDDKKDDEKDEKDDEGKKEVKEGENPFAKKDDDKKDDDKKDDDDKDDKKEVKEALDAIFAGEKLSESFKKKAATVFEAAVSSRVKSVIKEAKKQLMAENVQVLEVEKGTLAKKVDQYLNYVVEQWMKENELAVEKGIKNQLTEEFLIGLKKLFAENYIEVPQEKLDVVAALAQKAETLETKLNEQIDTNIELTNKLAEHEKGSAFAEVSKGLADTQIEKLRGLAESLSYKDGSSFKQSLQTLKESYFPAQKSSGQTADTRVPLTEDAIATDDNKDNENTLAQTDPTMASYVKALDRIVVK